MYNVCDAVLTQEKYSALFSYAIFSQRNKWTHDEDVICVPVYVFAYFTSEAIQ
jgi:hypothetical protein